MYKELFDLKEKIVVITGGANGIGLACSHAFLEFGAKVIILDLYKKETSVLKNFKKDQNLDYFQLDVTNKNKVKNVFDRIKKTDQIDVLINCAGIGRGKKGNKIFDKAEEIYDEDWLEILDVNLNGTFWCCREVGKQMIENHKGSIINIGSISGIIVNKPQQQSHYASSKAAVHHLTKSLAVEWAEKGVRVNAIAPTYINTDATAFIKNDKKMFKTWMEMSPIKRLGKTSEIASIALFLASEASSLITGSIVLADGGYTSL